MLTVCWLCWKVKQNYLQLNANSPAACGASVCPNRWWRLRQSALRAMAKKAVQCESLMPVRNGFAALALPSLPLRIMQPVFVDGARNSRRCQLNVLTEITLQTRNHPLINSCHSEIILGRRRYGEDEHTRGFALDELKYRHVWSAEHPSLIRIALRCHRGAFIVWGKLTTPDYKTVQFVQEFPPRRQRQKIRNYCQSKTKYCCDSNFASSKANIIPAEISRREHCLTNRVANRMWQSRSQQRRR